MQMTMQTTTGENPQGETRPTPPSPHSQHPCSQALRQHQNGGPPQGQTEGRDNYNAGRGLETEQRKAPDLGERAEKVRDCARPVLALAVGRGLLGPGPDVGPDCRLMTQSPRGWECVALGNCMDCISTWFPALTLNTFYLRFLVSLEDTGEQT